MAVIGIGTEIVECVRIAKMIETHGEQFLSRVYSPDEIDFCAQKPNATQHFSTHWAAKEAVMKALQCRNQGVRWTDVEIESSLRAGPGVVLGGAAQNWSEQLGIVRIHLSVGACRTHATAYVIATDEEERD